MISPYVREKENITSPLHLLFYEYPKDKKGGTWAYYWNPKITALDLFITEEEARGIPDIPQGMYRDPETGNYQVM